MQQGAVLHLAALLHADSVGMFAVVFKRYIKKDGKHVGPYYYQNVRDKDGKVKSVYIGKDHRKNPAKKNPHVLAFVLLCCALILACVGFYYLFFLQQPEPVITASSSFTVDHVVIKVLLKEDEFLTKQIKIANLESSPIDFSLSVPKLGQIVTLSEDSFTLQPGQVKSILANFSATAKDAVSYSAGVYTGRLVVSTAHQTKVIPVIIELESKRVLYDMTIASLSADRSVAQGAEILFDVRLFNLDQTSRSAIAVTYHVQDMEGNSIISETESLSVKTQGSFTKSVLIPDYFASGSYVFAVYATYGSSTGTASYLFDVSSEPVSKAPKGMLKTCSGDVYCWSMFSFILLLTILVVVFGYLILSMSSASGGSNMFTRFSSRIHAFARRYRENQRKKQAEQQALTKRAAKLATEEEQKQAEAKKLEEQQKDQQQAIRRKQEQEEAQRKKLAWQQEQQQMLRRKQQEAAALKKKEEEERRQKQRLQEEADRKKKQEEIKRARKAELLQARAEQERKAGERLALRVKKQKKLHTIDQELTLLKHQRDALALETSNLEHEFTNLQSKKTAAEQAILTKVKELQEKAASLQREQEEQKQAATKQRGQYESARAQLDSAKKAFAEKQKGAQEAFATQLAQYEQQETKSMQAKMETLTKKERKTFGELKHLEITSEVRKRQKAFKQEQAVALASFAKEQTQQRNAISQNLKSIQVQKPADMKELAKQLEALEDERQGSIQSLDAAKVSLEKKIKANLAKLQTFDKLIKEKQEAAAALRKEITGLSGGLLQRLLGFWFSRREGYTEGQTAKQQRPGPTHPKDLQSIQEFKRLLALVNERVEKKDAQGALVQYAALKKVYDSIAHSDALDTDAKHYLYETITDAYGHVKDLHKPKQ